MTYGYQPPQNQSTQFSTMQPQYAMLQFNPASPPYTVQCNLNPELTKFMPLLSGLVATELQNKAGVSPLRLYVFNKHAGNNFANQNFQLLVGEAAKYVLYLVFVKRGFQDWESACAVAASEMCAMITAVCYANDPGVMQVLPMDQATLRELQSLVQAFTQLQQQFNQMFGGQQVQQVQPTSPMGGFAAPNNFGVPNTTIGGFSGAAGFSGGFGRAAYNPSAAPSAQAAQPFGFTSAPAIAAPVSGATSNFAGRSYTESTSQAAPQDTRHNPHQAGILSSWSTGPVEIPTLQPSLNPIDQYKRDQHQEAGSQTQVTHTPISASEGQIQYYDYDGSQAWTPSIEQPYIPVYRPTYEKLMYAVYPDGTVRLHVIQLTQEEKMNVEQHLQALPNVQRLIELQKAATAPVQSVKTEQVPADASDPANTETVEHKSIPEFSHVKDEGYIMREGLGATVFEHNRNLLNTIHETGEVPMIYTSEAQVIEPIFDYSDGAGQELIKRLSSMRHLSRVAKELNQALDGQYGEEVKVTAAAIDAVFTTALNERIRYALSIEGVELGSFAAHLEAISNLMHQYYGDIADKLFVEEDAFIRTQLGVFSETGYRAFVGGLCTNDENLEDDVSQGAVSVFHRILSLTTLNCQSADLNVAIDPEKGSALVRTDYPVLHDIITRIFDLSKDEDVAEFWLVTRDRKFYRVERGLLGQGYYQIRSIPAPR